ncbi:acyl-CoA thioesterase [Curvivirga aplysinae]|uniref:acyl-CoA thioesterase n=1 Tax=Curvivirga aplysinae TaxID=2529852 RepID=UPI0012BC3C54|nr:thioesterase family protein [Curvivirga aplysinae]MTI11110.1 acyl-CoA thioesterase [Curvivirga aplysinae]
MAENRKLTRQDFRHFLSIPTRWMDNDVYGHVNNVTYYSYFDTVVNEHLITHAKLDPKTSREIGLVVETKCKFMEELSFPEIIDAGLRVSKLGNSSIIYEIGLFKKEKSTPSAFGHFVHVYVDREEKRPVTIPQRVRNAVEPLLI